MGNIYEGSMVCKTEITDIGLNDFIKKLNKATKDIHIPYVVVDCSGGIVYKALIVKYEDEIPDAMLQYKNRWILKDNQWIRLGLLGICDVCKQEKELICLCDKGHICENCCSEDEEF